MVKLKTDENNGSDEKYLKNRRPLLSGVFILSNKKLNKFVSAIYGIEGNKL